MSTRPDGQVAPPGPAVQAGEEVTLTITQLAPSGLGLGQRSEVCFLVPFALPGEEVVAGVERVSRARHRRRSGQPRPATPRWEATARVVSIVKSSPDRAVPACRHFGSCGGCAWQHQAYRAQLERKRALVRSALLQVLGEATVPPDLVEPVIPSPAEWHYRNKLELTFSPGGRPGFHRRGSFKSLIEVEECHLATPEMVKAARVVGDWAVAHGLPGYDKAKNQGFLRHLVVRQAYHTEELMVALETFPPSVLRSREPGDPGEAGSGQATAGGDDEGQSTLPFAGDLVERLRACLPQLTSLLWLSNPSPSDVVKVEGSRLQVLYGREFIEERLAGLTFRLELPTFFQTNTRQAETLLYLAREALAADARPTDLLFDLYCGVGTFGLALARGLRLVVGIELVESAVAAASANAARNGIDNVVFLAGEVRRVFDQAVARFGPPDLILLDPPRAGAGSKVIRRLGRAKPRRIVYVSCNPHSLAADLAELLPAGYHITRVQPVDLFPHTDHVETVVTLARSH